jgi:alkyl hydroperoxide reductase subunit AhpC
VVCGRLGAWLRAASCAKATGNEPSHSTPPPTFPHPIPRSISSLPSPHPLLPSQITAFSDAAAEFKKLGCEVVGLSVDSNFSHLAWTQQGRKAGGLGKMAIPLIGDITKAVSKAYGALVETPGDDLEGVTVRATYIIDPKGILRHVSMNDAPVGRSVEEVLRLVQAIQYSDKHDGQVCPAGWKPGSKSMTADPVKSKEFFANA